MCSTKGKGINMGIKFGEGKEIKVGAGRNMSDVEINLSKLKDGEKAKLRLVGEIMPNYRYWVKTRDGKKKPKLTPFFDRDTENLKAGDPLAGVGQKEFFYTVNCIDRSDNKMKILILKTTVYRYLYSLAVDPDYGNCADSTTGFDINIVKERTGPQPQNVKYNVSPSLKLTPLSEEEQAMELHNLEEIYDPGTDADYTNWVTENTTVFDNIDTNTSATGTEDIPF